VQSRVHCLGLEYGGGSCLALFVFQSSVSNILKKREERQESIRKYEYYR
jgi:hypothetical protein